MDEFINQCLTALKIKEETYEKKIFSTASRNSHV